MEQENYRDLGADGGAKVVAIFGNADRKDTGLVYFNRFELKGLIPQNHVLQGVASFLSANNPNATLDPVSMAETLRSWDGEHFTAGENQSPRFGMLFGHVWRTVPAEEGISISQITIPESDWHSPEEKNPRYRRTAAKLLQLALDGQRADASVDLQLSVKPSREEVAFYADLGTNPYEDNEGRFQAASVSVGVLRYAILERYDFEPGNLD